MTTTEALALATWNCYQESLLTGEMPDAVYYFNIYTNLITEVENG